MFPNPHHIPTNLREHSRVILIPTLVTRQFSFPVFLVIRRDSPMIWAHVPKAAIYKYSEFSPGEYKSGLQVLFAETLTGKSFMNLYPRLCRTDLSLTSGFVPTLRVPFIEAVTAGDIGWG